MDKLPVLDQRVSTNSKSEKEHSPLVIELLARTLERQAQNEPWKLYRDQKMRAAQIFREKMNARRKLNQPAINYAAPASSVPRTSQEAQSVLDRDGSMQNKGPTPVDEQIQPRL